MSVRTFTIHPATHAGESGENSLVLKCDRISLPEACLSIRTKEVRVIGQLANSSNGALLGEIDSDSGTFSVVIKPSMYENPLFDFPWGTLAKREVAAYELSQLLSWNIVPPTILRDVEGMEASVQLFIPHDPREHYFTLSPDHRVTMEKFAIFDYIANNADRKAGHILKEKKESFKLFIDAEESSPASSGQSADIFGIDHGLTFHYVDKLRTVIWEFSEEKISQDLVEDINCVLPKLAERLSPLLEAYEIEAAITRIEKLLVNPFHRALDANERAFPWPLV